MPNMDNITKRTQQQRQQLKEWAATLTSSKDPAARHKASNGLYRALYDSLSYFFLRKLGNFNGNNTYEDLTMRTLEKMFERIDQYDPQMGEFTTWVYRIATNTLIDERRQFRGYDVISVEAINHLRSSTDSENTSFEVPSQDDSQYQMITHHERQDHILGVIQRMRNKNDAAVLLLRFYSNYSYEEIVEEMNMPMGTVKARIKRAKEKLSTMLDPALAYA